MQQKQLSILKPLLCVLISGLMSTVSWSNLAETGANQPKRIATETETETETNSNLLYQIPSLIDAMPTVLPQQSDAVIVPPIQATEKQSWLDRKQHEIRNWTDRSSHKIDNWFGETDPNDPASATLRLIIDNSWNKHDGYEIKPRLRGKIKLPTLERKVSLIFGDDSLDNELKNNIAITDENPDSSSSKALDSERTRESNSSLALRWSDFSKRLPFETDLDLGIRSGDDIYLRLKASRDWQLENDFRFRAEQIYRYGIQSDNYLRTNLELSHSHPNQAFLSNQFSLTYSDQQVDDLSWDNYLFRQHQFFHNNRFAYGLYTGGFYNNNDLRLNSWGPYISWRQPFVREWFFLQGDLNYLNDQRENRSHFLGASVRLEALF